MILNLETKNVRIVIFDGDTTVLFSILKKVIENHTFYYVL